MQRSASVARASLAAPAAGGAAGKELVELYQASSKRCQALQQELRDVQVRRAASPAAAGGGPPPPPLCRAACLDPRGVSVHGGR
jgi:hypothetical protein